MDRHMLIQFLGVHNLDNMPSQVTGCWSTLTSCTSYAVLTVMLVDMLSPSIGQQHFTTVTHVS